MQIQCELPVSSCPVTVLYPFCILHPSQLLVKNLQFEDGKMIPASKYFSSGESTSLDLTDDEKKMAEEIRASKPLY